MTIQEFPEINLAAPCGFYCGTCSHYLARAKGKLVEKKLKHGCQGCRVQDKKCVWVKRNCVLLRKHEIMFCFECADFPCQNLKKLDARHVRDDGISMIANLQRIQEIGVQQWLEEQAQIWHCAECGGQVCGFDGLCYDCWTKQS